ncbi:unnamed protein product, partial [Mesorhabditis belari]|uniref:Uncharacterized protein n=1 Tax=Mesorhabditis belari TaxID=2138241 RepID=A0AAF3J6Y4_9BILA
VWVTLENYRQGAHLEPNKREPSFQHRRLLYFVADFNGSCCIEYLLLYG